MVSKIKMEEQYGINDGGRNFVKFWKMYKCGYVTFFHDKKSQYSA